MHGVSAVAAGHAPAEPAREVRAARPARARARPRPRPARARAQVQRAHAAARQGLAAVRARRDLLGKRTFCYVERLLAHTRHSTESSHLSPEACNNEPYNHTHSVEYRSIGAFNDPTGERRVLVTMNDSDFTGFL